MRIDAHCHLGSCQFDADREEVVTRMLEEQVEGAILICCNREDHRKALELKRKHPYFKIAVGIHPQDLERDAGEERLRRFRESVLRERPDMIGEIGLDYYSHPHTKESQLRFFHAQLALAQELGLPVDIHSRKAVKDTQEILKQYRVKTILHSFSGSVETAREYLKAGCYLSFGASVLFPNARRPEEVIRSVPAERMLLETDAPYQSPVKDHRHEPADVVNIYRKVSEIKGIPLPQLEAILEKNYKDIFGETYYEKSTGNS